ncbi:MAG: alpha/beta hydrolase [Spirochaetaceae bacterium]|nr:MAG: alpha/beta hydrolase [Spirochaetaceae bacterium]
METKSVSVRGIRISYREEGSGAQDVLYVHGNTGCNLWFEKVMSQEGCRVIAADMPNFGESDHIDTADIDLYADYMAEFCAALELENPVVVGHSLGGGVAMSLAVNHPAHVGSLMLVDSCAPGGLHTPEEHYPVIEMFRTNRDLLLQGLAATTPTLNEPEFLDRLVDAGMKMNGIAFAGNARALDAFTVEGKTASFTGPVLVVHGARDIIITREMAQETADAFPNGTAAFLEDVGHSVMVEDPDTFTRLLQEFRTKNT